MRSHWFKFKLYLFSFSKQVTCGNIHMRQISFPTRKVERGRIRKSRLRKPSQNLYILNWVLKYEYELIRWSRIRRVLTYHYGIKMSFQLLEIWRTKMITKLIINFQNITSSPERFLLWYNINGKNIILSINMKTCVLAN